MSPGEQTLIIPTQRAPVVYPTTISQIGIAAIVPKGTVLTPEVEKQIRGQYSRWGLSDSADSAIKGALINQWLLLSPTPTPAAP